MKSVLALILIVASLGVSAETANVQVSAVAGSLNLGLCQSVNSFDNMLANPEIDDQELYTMLKEQYLDMAKYHGFTASLRVNSPSIITIDLEKTVKILGDETLTTISYMPVGLMGVCIDFSEETGEIAFKCNGSSSIKLEGNLAGICPYLKKYNNDDSKLRQAIEDLIEDTIR